MTRKLLLTLLFSATFILAGQITTIYNTGVDGSGGLAATGSTDLHYTLTTILGPNTYVEKHPAWLADGPNSKWIAPTLDACLGCSTGTYIYHTTFDLTGFDPSTAVLVGKWSTDDSGLNIVLNGVSTGNTAGGYGAFYDFTISSGFIAGVNTLDFSVANGGGSWTGLRVEFTSATADPRNGGGGIPEPGTMTLLGLGLAALAIYRRRGR